MSVSLLTPDLRRILGDLASRVGILERRITNSTTSADTGEQIVFSYAGTLTASTSPPVRLRVGGPLTVLAVTFGTAGSTSTILAVERNGTTVATVTVPASTTAYNADIGARFAADSDILTLAVTTPGTGAADMTAVARFT